MEMAKLRIYIVIYSKLNKTKQMMEKTLDVSWMLVYKKHAVSNSLTVISFSEFLKMDVQMAKVKCIIKTHWRQLQMGLNLK